MSEFTKEYEGWHPGVGGAILYIILLQCTFMLPFFALGALAQCAIRVADCVSKKIVGANPHPRRLGAPGDILTLAKWLVALLLSYISVPVTIALLGLMYPDEGPPYVWANYPALFLTYLKGWVILSLDAVCAAPIALFIFVGYQALIDWSGHWRYALERWYVDDLFDAKFSIDLHELRSKLVSFSPWVFVGVSASLLTWTFLNVLFYAGRYGFFDRTGGGLREFMYCYLFTICEIGSILWMIVYMFGMMILNLGGLFLLGWSFYKLWQWWSGEAVKDGLRDAIDRAFGALVCCSVGVGFVFVWWFSLGCYDLRNGLRKATRKLYEPGAANETITWSFISNTTGNFNITQPPYRPPPLPSGGIGPLSEEFLCDATSSSHFLPFLMLAVTIATVYGVGLGLWKYMARRKAFAEGTAYEMMWGE